MSKKKITNTFTTRKDIRANSIFYRHLLSLAPEAVVIHSEGKIIYINKIAQKLVGAKSAKELIGKSVLDFIHPDSLPLIHERIKKMLNHQKVAPFAIEKFVTLKGEIVIAETKAVPFIFQGKQSILAILRDITQKRKQEEQQAFLDNLSKLLSSSIDYQTTLQHITQAIVPTLADYSRLILINEKKEISDIIAHHSDPKKLKAVEELYDAYKNRTDATHGIERILLTGKSEIIEQVTPKIVNKLKNNKHILDIIDLLGLTSYMGVPLKIRGKIIGALTFSSSTNERIYTKKDLQFAEEAARRISSALENALLYAQAQKTIEAEERLAAIVSYSDDAIISKTLEDTILSWNKAAEKMYGYTEKEAIGKPIRIIIPKELWGEEERIYRKMKKGLHIDHYETTRLRKDGTQISVSITMSAIRNSQGKIIGASKISRDITEKKKTESELSHLASLVESSSDAIWSRTLDNKILSWNKGAELMYGYTAREAINNDITKMIYPSDREEEVKEINKRILRGELIQAYETVRMTKDKQMLYVSMTISPLRDLHDKIIGASAIVRNITEQKEQERLKDEFISMASHELKTPITSMKIFLDILYSYLEKSNSDGLNYVSRIKDQANKIRDLVNDLLDVSRIGTGKLRFNNEIFHLEQVLDDTIEGMRPATRKHNLVFIDTSPLPVYGDRFRIYQVITNLLTNAIKYSPKGKKIIISAKKKKENAVVSVKDYGIGIAKDKQQKIFEKLYQVTDPEEKTFPGLGMGLYISNEIIKRHNGKMWVKSEKGKGATFYFSLPLKEE